MAISVFKRHSRRPKIHLCVVTFAVIREIIYVKHNYSCILKTISRVAEQHSIAVVVQLRVIFFNIRNTMVFIVFVTQMFTDINE
jgi:hypothetical protein